MTRAITSKREGIQPPNNEVIKNIEGGVIYKHLGTKPTNLRTWK